MAFVIDKAKMLPAQREWWDLENYIRLLVGGFGIDSGTHGLVC